MYTNLTKEESVHLSDWPYSAEASQGKPVDDKLLSEMQTVREIVEIGHGLRKENNIAVRQPLKEFQITNAKFQISQLEQILLDELNIKSVKYGQKENKLDLVITPELKEEADTRDLIRKIQGARKDMGIAMNAKVNLSTNWMPENKELKDWLLKKTLTEKVTVGEFSVSLA
jgi:isoleucyl-tRNA synthetase